MMLLPGSDHAAVPLKKETKEGEKFKGLEVLKWTFRVSYPIYYMI